MKSGECTDRWGFTKFHLRFSVILCNGESLGWLDMPPTPQAAIGASWFTEIPFTLPMCFQNVRLKASWDSVRTSRNVSRRRLWRSWCGEFWRDYTEYPVPQLERLHLRHSWKLWRCCRTFSCIFLHEIGHGVCIDVRLEMRQTDEFNRNNHIHPAVSVQKAACLHF